MSKTPISSRKRPRGIAAADVGKFLKHLALTMRDPRTGNPEMAEALLNLSTILLDAKLAPVEKAASRFMEQGGFDFDDEIDFGDLSTQAVQTALATADLTRAQLVILGTERFGIARSRLEKLPREEVIGIITAAIQHEESLGIIAAEARRGGQSRSS